MKVFITGVCGFIGSHVAEACLAAGHEVAGIDNLETGREENVPEACDWVEDTVGLHYALVEAFDNLMPDPDVVVHCAATYAHPDEHREDCHTNIMGAINVAGEAADRGAKQIIYMQTALRYGLAPESPVKLGTPIAPAGSSYAFSKTAAEQYLKLGTVPVTTLVLANCYGKRNLSGPVPTFFKRLTEGQECYIADTRRDFVFVDDLVKVIMAHISETPTEHRDFHVSSGSDESIWTLFNTVVDAMGVEVWGTLHPRRPDDAATILLEPSPGVVCNTPLAEGVAKAVEWYKANGVERTFTHLRLEEEEEANE